MTDQNTDQNSTEDARIEALQAVVDRVLSWHESAEEGTVEKYLDDALSEAGVDLDDAAKQKIVDRIADEHAEHFDVREVL